MDAYNAVKAQADEMLRQAAVAGNAPGADCYALRGQADKLESDLHHAYGVYSQASGWDAAGKGPLTPQQLDKFADRDEKRDMVLAFTVAAASVQFESAGETIAGAAGGSSSSIHSEQHKS